MCSTVFCIWSPTRLVFIQRGVTNVSATSNETAPRDKSVFRDDDEYGIVGGLDESSTKWSGGMSEPIDRSQHFRAVYDLALKEASVVLNLGVLYLRPASMEWTELEFRAQLKDKELPPEYVGDLELSKDRLPYRLHYRRTSHATIATNVVEYRAFQMTPFGFLPKEFEIKQRGWLEGRSLYSVTIRELREASGAEVTAFIQRIKSQAEAAKVQYAFSGKTLYRKIPGGAWAKEENAFTKRTNLLPSFLASPVYYASTTGLATGFLIFWRRMRKKQNK
jgi:hypothetical protein